MIGDLLRLKEIHLLVRDDGTVDLFISDKDKNGKWHHHWRAFDEGEEVGDLRQYTDGPVGEVPYRDWPAYHHRATA